MYTTPAPPAGGRKGLVQYPFRQPVITDSRRTNPQGTSADYELVVFAWLVAFVAFSIIVGSTSRTQSAICPTYPAPRSMDEARCPTVSAGNSPRAINALITEVAVMENFTPGSALTGGVLIGLSAVLLMGLVGRIAGISGIVNGLLWPAAD